MNRLLLLFLAFFFLIADIHSAQGNDYPDHEGLTARLRDLAGKYPRYASLESLTRTTGGRDIWVLSVGEGNLADRPAIAIIGGTEGDHLLGTELAVRFAEMLLAGSGDGEITGLLSTHTFYVFPDVNPDAREQYFSVPVFERKGNANSSYTDRYGTLINHPYKDLNGDGMISIMRIKDPAGEWIKHAEDDRIMVRALKAEGEKGEYHVYPEGVDLLKKERWTEAGVNFNRNFSYKYPVFSSGAGDHAVSEKETAAVARFLFDARNVYAVLSFGPANNLAEPLKYSEREASGRIITGILQGDAIVNQMVSNKYKEILDSAAGTEVPGSDGDFFQWAYFHYGRFSFSTPGWNVPRDKLQGGEGNRNVPGRDDDAGLLFVRWAEEQKIGDFFIPWERVTHPDFPDLEVEVGGIVPFAMTNPPFGMAESIAESHYRFIIELAAMRPAISISNVKTEEIGRGLYRVTADIGNSGLFPTVSGLGERLRWVQKTVVRLVTDKDQQMISGNRIEVFPAIGGGSSETRSWMIRGKGDIRLRAGAENSGFEEIIIKL